MSDWEDEMDWALKIAFELAHPDASTDDWERMAAALRKAKIEGLEEAAVYCDEHDLDWQNAYDEYLRGYQKEPQSLGDGIRALKDKP